MPNPRKKILIVEDDNMLRNILSDQLSRDYEIVQADDGEKGMQYILDYKPDLVILDILLPKLEGLEMLDRVRKYPDPAVAETKVIIFSNFSTAEQIQKAKVLNVADYLVKANTSLDDLVAKIKESL